MVVVPLGSFESPENVPLMVEEQQGENNEEVSEADEDQEESHIPQKNPSKSIYF